MYFKNLNELEDAMRNGELDNIEYIEERTRLLNNLPEWFPEERNHNDGFDEYFAQLLEEADAKIKAEAAN